MKILFVCHRFPYPPQRGGKIRPFNIIKHLGKTHEVTVASLVRSRAEADAGKGIEPYCKKYFMGRVSKRSIGVNFLKNFLFLKPLSMAYFYSSELKQFIDQEIKKTKFDLIFVHCSSVAQYVEHISDIPKIMDYGDMDSQKWLFYSKVRNFPLSFMYLYEGVSLMKAEKQIADRFSLCSCTTFLEKETLDDYHTGAVTDWFPNGVNTDFFAPSGEVYEPDTLCFLGRMDYFPNQECILDFCQYTLPMIKEKRPDVKLLIIGADPSKRILELDRIPYVTVTGSVEDVRPYVQKCAVNIAPLNIARGTQNKILESLSMGVPVVTSKVAAGGVDAVPGEHFLIAEGHEAFAAAVISLLENPDKRDQLSKAGRSRMMNNHNWEKSMDKLDLIIEKYLSLK